MVTLQHCECLNSQNFLNGRLNLTMFRENAIYMELI